MERNYKEDQANEIEALESIYCDDIESECWRLFYRKCLLFWLNCVYCVCFWLYVFFLHSFEHRTTQIQNIDINGRVQSGNGDRRFGMPVTVHIHRKVSRHGASSWNRRWNQFRRWLQSRAFRKYQRNGELNKNDNQNLKKTTQSQ